MDHIQATYFFQGIALGLSAAATPGPLQSFLISQTLLGSWRSGIMVAFAPLLSDPLVVFTIVFLLDQLPNSILNLIGIFGGMFALYIAFGIYRQWKETYTKPESGGGSAPESMEEFKNELITKPSRNFRDYFGITIKGIVMNVLSPGLYLFWFFITGPILLSALEDSISTGISFLLGFYIVLTTGLLTIVFIFNYSRRFGPRVIRILTLLSVLILIIFAAILITQGVYQLILSW